MEKSGKNKKTEGTQIDVSPKRLEMDRLARRGLLKGGALAMPLVLTFRSSAAWALSGGCALTSGTKPIPGTFTIQNTSGGTTPVIINQSVGDILTTQSSLTADEANFLISNGNLSSSCYTSITNGTGGPGGSGISSSSGSSSGYSSTSSGSDGSSSSGWSSSSSSGNGSSSGHSSSSSGNGSSSGHSSSSSGNGSSSHG